MNTHTCSCTLSSDTPTLETTTSTHSPLMRLLSTQFVVHRFSSYHVHFTYTMWCRVAWIIMSWTYQSAPQHSGGSCQQSWRDDHHTSNKVYRLSSSKKPVDQLKAKTEPKPLYSGLQLRILFWFLHTCCQGCQVHHEVRLSQFLVEPWWCCWQWEL